MAKLKTRRGAAKRFKATANGFKRKQAFKRHILTKKSAKRIRQLRGCVMVHVSDVASVRRMCPSKEIINGSCKTWCTGSSPS